MPSHSSRHWPAQRRCDLTNITLRPTVSKDVVACICFVDPISGFMCILGWLCNVQSSSTKLRNFFLNFWRKWLQVCLLFEISIKKQQRTQARTYFALLISLLYSYTTTLYHLHSINLNNTNSLNALQVPTWKPAPSWPSVWKPWTGEWTESWIMLESRTTCDGPWTVMAHAFANYIV